MQKDKKEKDPLVLARLIKLSAWMLIVLLLASIAVFLFFNWQAGQERNRLLGIMQGDLTEMIEQVHTNAVD